MLTGAAPHIEILSSTFAEDWGQMLKDQSYTDVKFILRGSTAVEAHSVVLTAASPMFRDIFTGQANSQGHKDVFEDVTWLCEAENCPNSVHSNLACTKGKTVITLDATITPAAFHQVLLFLYTGLPDITEDTDKDFVSEIKNLANRFGSSWLSQVCDNLVEDEAYLNPSIGTCLNDLTGANMKEFFFNKDLMSDVTFHVQNTTLHAHRVVLAARCDVMAAMLGGAFRESNSDEVRHERIFGWNRIYGTLLTLKVQ